MAGELERGPGPGALPDPDTVVIPDTPAPLEADMWALRAELARRRRQDRTRGLGARLAGRVGPMLLGGLLLVAFLASLAGIVRPTTVEPAQPVDLARTDMPDGSIGGLLPPAIVDVDGASVSLRSLRPAVLVWVPAQGAQQELLGALHLQAGSYGMPLVVAGPPQRQTSLQTLAESTGPAGTPALVDPRSELGTALAVEQSAGPTVVVVGADGRIHAVVRDPAPGIRLESVLSRAAAASDPVRS